MHIAHKEEIHDATRDVLYYISVSEKSKLKIRPYLNELYARGLEYFLAVKSKNDLENPVMMRLCEENIKKASVAIFVLDDEMMAVPEFLNLTLFECGVISSCQKEVYLVNNSTDKEKFIAAFNELPIREMQLTSFEAVIEDIDSRRTLPQNLFAEKAVNEYANERIFYIRMLISLDIHYGSLEKIYNRLEGGETMEYILERIQRDVSAGLTFFHFEKAERRGHACMWPYRDEMQTLCLDFPVRNSFPKLKLCKMSFEDENEETDIVATYQLELVLPNNELLGSSFKPFLMVGNSIILASDLEDMLVREDVARDAIKVVKQDRVKRVYFPLSVNGHNLDCEIDEKLLENYGKTCNYVFPK